MQAVILAAGRGTRLFPITETRTKAMCPVAGKPMVERVMDTLVTNGITDIILVISPDDPEIIDYFEHKSQIKAKIRFAIQEKQLGMGHALLQAVPYIQDDFILSSCDNLVENKAIIRMLTLWAGCPPPNGILALLRVGPTELTRMGVVEMDADNHIIRIVEKPTLEEAPSNIGSVPIYLFSPKLVDYVNNIQPSPRGEYELQDAIQEMIEKDGDVYGMLLPLRIDLTHPEDLLRLNLHFLKQQTMKTIMGTKDPSNGTHFTDPVIIENDVTFGVNCKIGPNVFVESGVTIGNNVWLENCVVLRGQKVPDQVRLKNKVIFE